MALRVIYLILYFKVDAIIKPILQVRELKYREIGNLLRLHS